MIDKPVRVDTDKLKKLRDKIQDVKGWGFMFDKEALGMAMDFYIKNAKPEK